MLASFWTAASILGTRAGPARGDAAAREAQAERNGIANSVSFWRAASGMLLINLLLVIGEFSQAGWLA